MTFQSINPVDSAVLAEFPAWDVAQLEAALAQAAAAASGWAATPLLERCRLMRRAAQYLRDHRDALARIITLEMGKLIRKPGRRSRSARWPVTTMPNMARLFLPTR